ncbi:MAG: SGNH/GDSL hydrolase family protein [Kiritimatiellia bacterium]|jgi:lysophospholipase L1-like esterase
MTPRFRIVCFGDSITGCRPGEPYRHLYLKWADLLGFALEVKFGAGCCEVVNAGHAGDTACVAEAPGPPGSPPGAPSRLASQVLDHAPDLVIVLLGGNDFAPEAVARRGDPSAAVQESLESIGKSVLASGAALLFLQYPPAQASCAASAWTHLERANPVIAAAAASLSAPCFDPGPAFRAAEARGVPREALRDPNDGVHLRPVGEVVFAQGILDAVAVILFKTNPLHITSGDCAGDRLARAGLPGDVLVWHDILYDGVRKPGWPDDATFAARAELLEASTGGGLGQALILKTLERQYQALEDAAAGRRPMVLWFDACLFDMAMLAHILACLHERQASDVELLCIDAFPGIEPYNGLGQLQPEALASCHARRKPVTAGQFAFAVDVDRAFAEQDFDALARVARMDAAPLPWMPPAAARWIAEQPDPATGLGRLATLALDAIRGGSDAPSGIFKTVAAADPPPQYWGDTQLWRRVNELADRDPPLVRIEGPAPRLPLWTSEHPLDAFRILPTDALR